MWFEFILDIAEDAKESNPLDDVAGDLLVAAVVEAGCARVGVDGKALVSLGGGHPAPGR